MKFRRGLLMWAFWFALLVSFDLLKWAVRGKPPTVDGVIGSLALSALFGWCLTLSWDALGVAFLAFFVAVVLCLIAYIAIGRAVHLSLLEDAVATYASEFLPFLVAVRAVRAWERRAGRRNE